MEQDNGVARHEWRCNRCGAEVHPGRGDFYLVRIDALADPWPPVFSDEDLQRDPRAEIECLIQQMRGLSEQEAMDQVYRQWTLCLCTRCYRVWSENPLG